MTTWGAAGVLPDSLQEKTLPSGGAAAYSGVAPQSCDNGENSTVIVSTMISPATKSKSEPGLSLILAFGVRIRINVRLMVWVRYVRVSYVI